MAITVGSTRPLTDFEHVLLGYIAREPHSGYGLKRRFNATPSSVYRPSPGALYPALRRLLKRGLLSVEDAVSAGHRAQRLYQATEAGLAAHLEWLQQPVDPATVGSDLGIHLMRFALMEDYVERPRVIAYLAELASALDSFIADLEHYLVVGGKPGKLHGLLAVEHGIATHRASLDWAREAIAMLAGGQPASHSGRPDALPRAAFERPHQAPDHIDDHRDYLLP